MITIDNITVAYNNNKKVINNLSLMLEDGLIHGIVGLNGAGKTTLLNTIYGLKKSISGTIERNNSKLNKRNVAYLTTDNFFYTNITGREYLSLFRNSSFNIDEWNQLFLLPLDTIVEKYSTGMKKKLALMSILKQDKPITILDEPFNGLDIESCRIIRMILLKLKEKGKTVIITSHIIETLTNLCDLIHYLDNGQIKYTRDKSGFTEFETELFAKIENDNSAIIEKLL